MAPPLTPIPAERRNRLRPPTTTRRGQSQAPTHCRSYTGGLPTPRTTLRGGYEVLMWGGGLHQAFADLQAIIDPGRGDAPLIRLRYRCSKCGGKNTDWVVGRGSVQ